MEYCIKNDRLEVVVESNGAKLKSVRLDGVERVSEQGAFPVLFPVCGRCAFVLNGENRDMPFHGFANEMDFSLEKQEESALTLSITDTETTRKCFPYAFRFCVEYSLHEDTLFIKYVVENRGEEDMYFACGGHEGYLLNGKVSTHSLRFSQEEVFDNLLHNNKGRLTGKRKRLAQGKILPLKKRYFFRAKTVILKGIQSRKVELIDQNGRCVNEISFDGFANLLLWMPPKTSVLCIEPWLSLPDQVGKTEQEVSQKEGFERLEKGMTKTLVRSIVYR